MNDLSGRPKQIIYRLNIFLKLGLKYFDVFSCRGPNSGHLSQNFLSDFPAMAGAAKWLEYRALISVLKQSLLGIIRLFIYRYGWKMIKSHGKLYQVGLWTVYAYICLWLWPELGLVGRNYWGRQSESLFRYYKIIDKEHKLLPLDMLCKCCDKSQVKFQLSSSSNARITRSCLFWPELVLNSKFYSLSLYIKKPVCKLYWWPFMLTQTCCNSNTKC